MAILALHSASTGLSALSTALDVVANNLANTNTPGFKGSRANFEDLLYLEKAQPGVENANADQRPTGLYVGLGTKLSGTQISLAQGPAQATERPLDIMIEGDGFFAVQVEADLSDGGVAYTRAGNFALNADGEIVLANAAGRRLDPPITIPENYSTITVNQDGSVYVGVNGEQDAQLVGTIETVNFVNPAGLKHLGGNLFAPTAASGDPNQGEPGTDGRGTLRQNFLEGSNVDPVIELVELIRTQRAFELNSQSIQAADEVLQSVGQLRSF